MNMSAKTMLQTSMSDLLAQGNAGPDELRESYSYSISLYDLPEVCPELPFVAFPKCNTIKNFLNSALFLAFTYFSSSLRARLLFRWMSINADGSDQQTQ